ncbi:Nif3-like dinuclear metal center hexameric protein [Cohnella sp. CFH 77786]|uniref:Nif3-like dinuclear metal center hexameric protein n=1 Tax=Cohnella sp. CFH 77786 TaxID=2662265 RepID=UPI001C6096F5|nr:Nif3-like dinuclear metal center hexameric protein [Cohnella sp. CFH 77786]MBW5444868.1 Nif3-like dinuclear metal center hexameric protein [Cohnella sp. CFH 77786]
MFARGETVIQMMERLAPKHYAEPEDKIGLQVGSARKEVSKVLVALDVTPEVVAEAAALGAELIIAHHAVIYRPLAHLQTDTPSGALAAELLKRDIAVYVAHTNLDSADGGMNDWMADALGLEGRQVLREAHTDKLYKLAVFVPQEHQAAVRDAMFAAGAGWIGNYSHCSFNVEGTGTFMPREGSDPYIGRQGKLETAAEVRIETIVPQSVHKAVIAAMLKAHPYEEAAYDLYPMELKGRSFGLGRVGKLPADESLDEFAERVKRAFDVPFVRVVGEGSKRIRKVAVLGGSGSRFIRNAMFAGADVLVTGDIDYHTAQDAAAAGLALVDPGHNAEKIMKAKAAEWLQLRLAEQGYATQALASQVNTEPFRLR